MSATEEKKRVRRPPPRPRDVIIGCIYERVAMWSDEHNGLSDANADRIRELLDELQRSLRNGNEEA